MIHSFGLQLRKMELNKPKKYSELSATEAIQADCDIKATNIILQWLPHEVYALNGDDPIDVINHMMSFLTAVITSRCPTTNNQLRNSSNPRQQTTINNGRVTLQPIQGRQTSLAAGTTRTYTPGPSGSNSGRYKGCSLLNRKGNGTTCPNNALNLKGNGMILGLRIKMFSLRLCEFFSYSSKPTKVEVPKELPKVSMVNTSLKKLKHNLVGFDVAVEQHRLESKTFEVKMNQVLNKNERLLEQVISKDIVNTIVNSSVDIASVNVHECEKCLKLKTELLNKKDFVEKEIYNKLFKSFTTLEKHCISLEVDTQLNQEIFQRDNFVSNQSAPSFDQLFELNELKAQSQEKDTSVEISDLNASLREKVLEITYLKDDLRKLKGKALVDSDVTKHHSDPEMLKIDVEPITPKLCIWRPTGRTFTIVGNACLLTKITTTTEVPLRKPTALENETPKSVVTLVYSRKPRKSKINVPVSKSKVVQIVLWYLDSGCSKHMIGDRSQLTNFVNKFLEKESLMQMVTLLKNDFKKEESRNIDREIALEKRIKQLDNIVFKRDQSAQTVHMLTKPQFFYDHTTKQALGFQNPFYLKKAQQLEPKLYVGDIIEKTNPIVIPDSERP
ncbi:hypothetical protein Tco_1246773 [Tanacetum coccineum]